MIKFEHTEVFGWEADIRGIRNSMNCLETSDSFFNTRWIPVTECLPEKSLYDWVLVRTEFNGGGRGVPHVAELRNGKWYCDSCDEPMEEKLALKVTDWRPIEEKENIIGPNDLELMKRLNKSKTDHMEFMQMITVYTDITAPLYWWKEFDTHKAGTVANSCSTMHKIHAKKFTLDDFSFEHLLDGLDAHEDGPLYCQFMPLDVLSDVIIPILNKSREKYLETKDKKYWWQMIQLLPTSYNQKRTVTMNYQNLMSIYKQRKGHKLDEWSEFRKWIESLPYAKEFFNL